MGLKIFLFVIIAVVGGSIMLLTGTLVPILLVLKSAVIFILQFVGLIFLIWLGGQVALNISARFHAARVKLMKARKAAKLKRAA